GAAFWVFAVHSLTSATPFLDPRLLLNRNFAIGLLIAFFMGMLAYTSLVLFPSLLHDLRGYPDAAIGELLAARGIGNWMAFLVVIPISRRFPRLTVALGLSAQSFSAWSIAQLNLNLSSYDVFWTNALQGFGFGLAFTPMTVLCDLAGEPADRSFRGLYAGAEFRLEPLYLALGGVADPVERGQLCAPDRGNQSVQSEFERAGRAQRLEHRNDQRADSAGQCGPAAGLPD